MSLIKSISGIRGTIGGQPNENLTPPDIVKFTAAYGTWLMKNNGKKVVVGRDGRISGHIVHQLVINTLLSMGIDVIDADLSTTPTVELAVIWEQADGGIIISASHNPQHWNALKLLNNQGEFISAEDSAFILQTAAAEGFVFSDVNKLGTLHANHSFIDRHIKAITDHKWVNVTTIREKNYTVVVDAINSTGALAVPALLRSLGVQNIILINGRINGRFAHNPEPLPEHLTQLCAAVKEHKADLGIAVDPDVDRLCFVCEDGTLFGEEYTLVAVADYILGMQPGNTVSNLSSTKALKDVTQRHGGAYFAAPVGEVNVVKQMKAVRAFIGGEGNGGIILPDLHYGRDAMAGIGLFLTALAQKGTTISAFRKTFPDYFMAKKKVELTGVSDVKTLLEAIKNQYKQYPQNTEDGLKIEMENCWIHLRYSNTEPIIRIYTEALSPDRAETLGNEIIRCFNQLQNLKQTIAHTSTV